LGPCRVELVRHRYAQPCRCKAYEITLHKERNRSPRSRGSTARDIFNSVAFGEGCARRALCAYKLNLMQLLNCSNRLWIPVNQHEISQRHWSQMGSQAGYNQLRIVYMHRTGIEHIYTQQNPESQKQRTLFSFRVFPCRRKEVVSRAQK